MVRPQDENFLQNKTEAPEKRAKKAELGKAFVIALACFAALMIALYVGLAIFGLSFA